MFNVIWPLAKNLRNVRSYNQTDRTNITYQGLVETILPDMMQNTAMKCSGFRGRTSKAQVLDHGPCREFLARMYNYIFYMIFWQPQYKVLTLELSILFLNRPRTSNRHFPWRWRWAGNPGSNPGSSENFYKSSYSATFVPRSDNVGLSLSQSSWTVCSYQTWHDLIYSSDIPLFYEYTK